MSYGLTPDGFLIKPFDVIKSQIEDYLEAEFGEINLDPESVFGQLIGGASKALIDYWETLEAVYYSQYPNSAEGIALDNVAMITGLTRLDATYSTVIGVVGNVAGTVIPINSIAKQPTTNRNFYSVAEATISASNTVSSDVNVLVFTSGANYTITVNGTGYTVSSLVSSQDLINNFVTAIGSNVTSIHDYYATAINSTTVRIQSFESTDPFVLGILGNLEITNVYSPVTFRADETGAIAIPAHTVNQVVTSISGWNSIDNWEAGTQGRNIETDAEFRLRRAKFFLIGGYATPEAIKARLLQEVPGVTHVDIIENRSMQQADQVFTYNTPFGVGTSIDVIMNDQLIGNVPYVTSQNQTLINVTNLIKTVPGVEDAVVTVAGSQITVSFLTGYQMTENDLVLNQSGDQFLFSKSGGNPPKSYEAIVQGGTDEAVAANLWKTKPAGIETFGNTKEIITDSSGNLQAIFFSRPEDIYIWVRITYTENPEETPPPDLEGTIRENVLLYGNSLGVGQDVILQRILCKVIDVQGIASATVTLYANVDPDITPNPGDYVATNISIGPNQIAIFDATRITFY